MTIKTLLFVSVIAVAAIMILTGCEKKEPASTQNNSEHTPTAAADETIIQKTCPVMGNPINKDIFVEYKGKKVYFCCPACKPEFEKNPENYISKLPQFQK